MRKVIPCLPIACLLLCGNVYSGVLTNSRLEVVIREDNGAIDAYLLDIADPPFGVDFYNPSYQSSNFGFQNGTDRSAGVLNTTDPDRLSSLYPEVPVVVTEGRIVSGTFTSGGANVDFVRSYSLVGDIAALQTDTTLTNRGTEAINLRYYESYDPDPGILRGGTFSTFNDVFSLEGATVGQAIAGVGPAYTALLASTDSRAVVGFSPYLTLFPTFGGTLNEPLNEFLSDPQDPDGARKDRGLHLAFDLFLDPGETTTVKAFNVGGLTPEEAQGNLLSILSDSGDSGAIPEPSTLAVFAIGSLSVLFHRRKRGRASP